MWEKQRITEKVLNSVERYGYSNPQQFTQLEFVLRKSNAQEVFDGLIEFFINTEIGDPFNQETAGRLLYRIAPKADFELERILRSSLGVWDYSVEEFLCYFVERCGEDVVSEAVYELEGSDLLNKHERPLKTMHYWLSNYNNWLQFNG